MNMTLTLATNEWLHLEGIVRAVGFEHLDFAPPVWLHGRLETSASGTVVEVLGNTLVACVMYPAKRVIVHSALSLADTQDAYSGLTALDTPYKLPEALRRHKGKLLRAEFSRDRVKIHFAARREWISFPSVLAQGRMLSPVRIDPLAQKLRLDARELEKALEAVDSRVKPAAPSVLSLVVSPESAGLWSFNGRLAVHQVLQHADLTAVTESVMFHVTLQQRRMLSKLVTQFRRRQDQIEARVTSAWLTLYTEHDSLQIHSDVATSQRLAPPATMTSRHGLVRLVLDDEAFVQDHRAAKGLRGILVTKSTDQFEVPPVRWILQRGVVQIDISSLSADMLLEAACQCESWSHEGSRIDITVDPRVTAFILESIATVPGPHSVLYRRGVLTVATYGAGFEIKTRVLENPRKRRIERVEIQEHAEHSSGERLSPSGCDLDCAR